MTTKIFMSSRLLIETRIIVIMSSSFAVRLKKKKNRKIIFVVLFFSKILSLKEEKENRRTIFVVLFFSMKLIWKEKKKNRKAIFVVLFFSKMMFSIKRKKNQRTIFVDFSFDRASSSSSLSSSFISFKSRFVTQSFRSLSWSIFKNIAIMFDALMKNVVNFSKIRLKKKYLTKLHHEFFLRFRSRRNRHQTHFAREKELKKWFR